MTIILFFAVLFVLILVHEWGHYFAAKRTDMRVDEFGIGFPPKLFGVQKGETEYTFNLLPIGGFVRILGENSESSEFSPVESEAIDRRSEALNAEAGEGGAKSELPQGSNKTANANVIDPRSFAAKSKLAQAIVLIAGVTMNVIFAWFLFVLVFMIGVPTPVDEASAGPGAELVIQSVLPDSPADAAGLAAGMRITSLDRGVTTAPELTPSAFSTYVSATTTSVNVVVASEDQELVYEVTPETGVISTTSTVPAIGVSLSLIENVRYSFGGALWEATETTGRGLVAIVVGLSALIAQSVVGTADFSQVAGPVGIAGLVGDAAAFGFTSLLWFTAIISLNLAIINLLPFPALDGGRLVFVAIEAVTRKPINPIWVMRLNTVGFILLLALMVAVTYSDIIKLL